MNFTNRVFEIQYIFQIGDYIKINVEIARLSFLFIHQFNFKARRFFVKIKKIKTITERAKKNEILNLSLLRLSIKKKIIELFIIKSEKLCIISFNSLNNENDLRFIHCE